MDWNNKTDHIKNRKYGSRPKAIANDKNIKSTKDGCNWRIRPWLAKQAKEFRINNWKIRGNLDAKEKNKDKNIIFCIYTNIKKIKETKEVGGIYICRMRVKIQNYSYTK